MRYDSSNASIAGDRVRAEVCSDPIACPPDAPPGAQDKVQQEARNYAVENIPRYDEELEAADDNDDLFGKIGEDGSEDPTGRIPSGSEGGVGGQGQVKSPLVEVIPADPAPPGCTTSGAEGGD